MKLARLFLLLTLLASVSAKADVDTIQNCRFGYQGANILTDIIFIRPVSAVGTLVGGALFIGLSPLTALASIAPPHDAFQKTGAILVGVPYNYAFVRPVGYFGNSCN